MALPISLDQIKSEFLRQCGIHDYGLVGFACNCPDSDPRWIISALVSEVELLQAKIAKYESEGEKNEN